MTEETLTPVQTLEEKIKIIDLQIDGVNSNITHQLNIISCLESQKDEFKKAIGILNEYEPILGPITLLDKIELSECEFVEENPGNIEWKEPYLYKDVEVFRSSDEKYLKIRWSGSTIISTWDYLKSFYETLPEIVTRQDIKGFSSKRKVSILLRFYEAHPNFTCHIDRLPNKMELIKDNEEIKLNQDTNGGNVAIEYDEGISD